MEVQVKIERNIETEPTGGAQGGVAGAAAGGSGSMHAHPPVKPVFEPSTNLEEMLSVMSAIRMSISDAGQLSPMTVVVPARKSRRPITVEMLKWMSVGERGERGCNAALYLLCQAQLLCAPGLAERPLRQPAIIYRIG